MPVLRRPGRVLELRSGPFRCRLQPLNQKVGYRVQIFHHKPSNGYVDTRLIFKIQDLAEVEVLIDLIDQVFETAKASEDNYYNTLQVQS